MANDAFKTASPRTPTSPGRLSWRILLAICAALVLGACDDSESSSEDGKPAGTATPRGESSFVVGARIFDDTDVNSYVHVLPSLEEGTPVDLKQAIEFPGAAKLFGLEQMNWFALGDGEAPIITQHTLDASGELQAGERVSLRSSGVESLWDTLYYVSETKVYYPDRDNAQLLILNPKTMTLEGEIELPQTVREGYLAVYGYSAIVRDDKLIFSVGWFDWETNDRVLAETGLVVLDTKTDTVVSFEVDARCGGITQSVATPSGDTYFISSALAAAAHRLERLSTEPCALKIGKGADAFDPDYLVKLAEVTGHPIAGEPVATGTHRVLLRVMDEAKAEVRAESLTYELTGQLLWQWWSWDVTTGAATALDGVPPATADVSSFRVGDKVYGAQTTEDYSETTLAELNAKDGPKNALTVPGFVYGVVQVQR